MTCFDCCCHCFILMGGISELSSEFGFDSNWFRSSIFPRLSKFRSSVESWNTDSILSWSENFERWWRKSMITINLGSYGKLFFNFLEWTLTHQAPSSSESGHDLLI